MASTNKGNTWHFGLKVQVCSGPKGRTRSVMITPVSVHEAKAMAACPNIREKTSTATVPMQTKNGGNVPKKRASYSGCVARPTGAGALSLNLADRLFNRKSNRARFEYPFSLDVSIGQVSMSCQEHGPSLHPVRLGQLRSGPMRTGV